MRRGYCTATFNARGVYAVDPTGKPEDDLAKQFLQKADDVENAGFHRFAVILKDNIAESYKKQADRIRSEHKK